MNRQKILIAACVLGSLSIGANIWLLSRKKDEPAAKGEQAKPGLPTASNFDFEDTSFADGSWKLEVEKPKVPKMTPEGEPAGPGFEETRPDADETKEKPVFGGTALGNEGWKLGDGKKEEEPPTTIGPPRSEPPPPAPAPPQEKSAFSGPEVRNSALSPSVIAEELWSQRDLNVQAVEWDRPFSFDDFTLRQQQATREFLSRQVDDYIHNSRGPFDVVGVVAAYGSDRLKDTAGSVPAFERRFTSGANNLRGWDYREVESAPANDGPGSKHLPR